MSAPRPIPLETRDTQRRASDPASSAWVAAHAGSGKTHVLTQRVVRLLLSGVAPSRILCLTYTKAAAANMSSRIFNLLARWALLDDDALTKAILDCGEPASSPARLREARRLFARAVETPGGLKIQTIHAFCERVLHLFPFEANVPAGFRVIDDRQRADLFERARLNALQRATTEGGALSEALARIAAEASRFSFDALLREYFFARDALQEADGSADGEAALRDRLGLSPGDTLSRIETRMIEGGVAPPQWGALAKRLAAGGANDGKLAEKLVIAAQAGEEARLDLYLEVFFTLKGEPRGAGKTKIISKKLIDDDPSLLALLEGERDRLAALIPLRAAAAALERSLALALVAEAALDAFSREKSTRGLFDFDDLIERTRALLNRSSPSWVLYKLDSQLDHILLDEAQDTSAAQWDILETFVTEFCAGESARRETRSFFAVGDEKQSIFSFQGAAPEKFDAMRRQFSTRFHNARLPFDDLKLTRSFRSAPEILSAVDAVFATGATRKGLSADALAPAPRHEAWKSDVSGRVEIWECAAPMAQDAPADWRLPLDYVHSRDPAAQLAEKIARRIRLLLAPAAGESVEDKGARRPVRAGDILILVRKRDAFFESMIRALKAENIPVAGADRLDLTGHIAVMDLLALARAALLPEDDLTFAALMKSPLFGVDDDDLIELAPKREGALWRALAASDKMRHRAAAEQFARWREAAHRLPPFDFYALALGAGGGRKRMIARLGVEANDAIDEFLRLALSFERDCALTLATFVRALDELKLSVKRDMEEAGAAVRVMTVHAAKGLEAKIVFLPDTCGAPAGRHDPSLFEIAPQAPLLWSRNMGSDPPVVAAAREALREEARDEHQRLLYVALTRAEERLYVAGYHGAQGRAAGCWYDSIRDALAPRCASAPDPIEAGREILVCGDIPKLERAGVVETATARVGIPEFALRPAPQERAPAPPLRPSSAIAAAEASAMPGARTAAQSERLLIGRLTHALLQELPKCAEAERETAARRFLDARARALDEATRDAIAARALAVLKAPELAPLFGSQSVAEAEIAARIATPRGEIAIAGRMDRLAETPEAVIIADYKAGRAPPSPGFAHLRQLALYRAAVATLYPEKRLRCLLVFTEDAGVVEIPAWRLDAAFETIVETEAGASG
jgi:ATP-dependent helicase/nuclease subunit A